jgi:hypothetical protein
MRRSKFLIDRKTLCLRVAREMALDSLRQKPFPSALASAREGGASALGPHARAKTVLLLSRSFRWLISAFHTAEKSAPRELKAVTLGWGGGLSIYSKRPISILDFAGCQRPQFLRISNAKHTERERKSRH